MTDKEVILERMIKEYGDSMVRTAYLYLSDSSLAQDAVQESFIKIYTSLDRFEGRSSEKTWIMRILINCCKNYRRTNWFRLVNTRLSLDEIAETVPVQMEHDDTLEEVMRLPSKYKDVILLYYYQELNTKEISQVLSCPESTVRVRLKRGRERLKSRLEADDELI